MVLKIKKRDGRLEDFDPVKIEGAMHKAFLAVEKGSIGVVGGLTGRVVNKIEKEVPTVEEVQDIVEETLIEAGFSNVARAYIIYRNERFRLREKKRLLGVKDDLKLSVNGVKLLRNRYLLIGDHGEIMETPVGMMKRVADAVGKGDEEKNSFFHAMKGLYFLPNSPTLMNAGTPPGQLSACFVLPVEDNIPSIFDAVKNMAIIHKSGGGTGFSFTHLRPKGDVVGTTKGIASGPLSFMRIYDVATEVIKQGGKRRGANMGVLNASHPDVLSFINSKVDGSLKNFNISVGVDDLFFKKRAVTGVILMF